MRKPEFCSGFFCFNDQYKRSAGLKALHFQFAEMFANIQFAQINTLARITLIHCYLLTFIGQFPKTFHSSQKPSQCRYLTRFFVPFSFFSTL